MDSSTPSADNEADLQATAPAIPAASEARASGANKALRRTVSKLSNRLLSLEKDAKMVKFVGTGLAILGVSFSLLIGKLYSNYTALDERSIAAGTQLQTLQVEQKELAAEHEALKAKIETSRNEIQSELMAAKKDLLAYAEKEGKAVVKSLVGKTPFIAGRTKSFKNKSVSLGYSSEEYLVVVTGFAATGGDIQEDDVGNPIIVRPVAIKGVWHIEADFRSHRDDEEWVVYYVAVRRDLVKGAY